MSEDPFGEDASDEAIPAPEFEVWNHLWSGYDMAYADLQETIGDDAARIFDSLGSFVYDALTRLVVDLSDPNLTVALEEVFPGTSGSDPTVLFQSLFQAYRAGSSPVLRHSVELQLGSEAISRAQAAFGRLHLLSEVLRSAPLPIRVRRYLAEVVHTFLFGFDAASIALARSAFEQMAREVLVHKGVYTTSRLDREKPTALNLMRELKRENLIQNSLAKAETLVTRANTVAHKHMYDERIMQQQALTSIIELVSVLTELAPHQPPPPDPTT